MSENRNGLTLLRSEDWMAVWLGFVIIAVVLLGLRPPLPRFSWATDGEFAATVLENKPTVEKLIKDAEARGEADLAASAAALKTAMDTKDRKAIGEASKKFVRRPKRRKTKRSKKTLPTSTG